MITSLIGALMGLGGSVIPEILGFFKRNQEHKQELELRRLDAEIAKQQAEMRLQEADLQVDHAHMQGVYEQFKNQKTDTWVDRLNALVRPVVTFAFLFMFLTALFSIIGQSIAMGAGVMSALTTMLPMIDAYFSAILAFWFGNRQIQKNKGQR